VQFRILTLLVATAVLAPPLSTIASAKRSKSLILVLSIWAIFLAAPLLARCLVPRFIATSQLQLKERVLAFIDSLAVVGYPVAFVLCWIALGLGEFLP
jgi:hypothetical protein